MTETLGLLCFGGLLLAMALDLAAQGGIDGPRLF
jgi:hypothetical protein